MIMTAEMIDTRVGRLHVEIDGEGPPAVLWHSLFVDSTTWSPMRPTLRTERRLILIDGPGHGGSGLPRKGFRFDECAGAATDVLDALGVTAPVDWLGNAWGGHIGIVLAARAHGRMRSLVTVATPAHALTRTERMKAIPMVWAYRLAGPVSPLANGLVRALLGPEFVRARPAEARSVRQTFRDTPRTGMLRAVQSVMLHRPSIESLLPQIDIPTMMIAPTNDPMLSVAQVRAAVATLPHAVAVEIPAGGHVAPIIAHADRLAKMVVDFWRDPAGRVSR